MKGFGPLFAAATAAVFATCTLATPAPSSGIVARADSKTPPVTVKGNAFFAGNNRFYIRGVDYQPGGPSNPQDPIADTGNCTRDIEYFKQLGINTIRIYSVDSTLNHDECMTMLSDAGIYLALDVNSPKYSINRAEPHPSYNDVYLQYIFAVIDAFAKYDNTLLFYSANEVINDNFTTSAAPYVKAVTRDMKQYINARGYRPIPVGYSAADVDSNRFEMATYMNCGSDAERSDFFAFNDYSWCNPSSYEQSGWNVKVKTYSDYSIPLFLSEYGCNTGAGPRTFDEVSALYGDQMTPVYSGGLAYEYSQEEANFGLVEISGSGVTERDDFKALKNALAKSPLPKGDGGYKQNGAASACPKESATWNVTTNDLPTIPEPAKKYLQDGAGKGQALDGPGSQTAGTASTSNQQIGTTQGGKNNTQKGAAPGLVVPSVSVAPFVCGLVVLATSLFGATTLL